MNFEKYSKQQFVARGLDTPAARQLADELQDDVARELHEAVLAAFMKVVEGLNARHHPRPSATIMRDFVMGRRVQAVVRWRRLPFNNPQARPPVIPRPPEQHE